MRRSGVRIPLPPPFGGTENLRTSVVATALRAVRRERKDFAQQSGYIARWLHRPATLTLASALLTATPVKVIRHRAFAILIAMLTLAGYGYELHAHALPECESSAEHQSADPDNTCGDCDHGTCHSSPLALDYIERLGAWQKPLFLGYAAGCGDAAPESVPLGIDHPPQLL